MAELLTPHYNWPLVALSIFIAIAASYAALDLASSLTVARGRARSAWLIGGSLAMGVGIWSMHFVGMLAFHVPGVPMAYNVPLLLLSVLVSVAASALALTAVSRSQLASGTLVIATIAMGTAIAGMHYIGMLAMRMPATITWRADLVALSVAIAFGASAVALWTAFRYRSDLSAHGFRSRALGALVMGFAISGMHYVGMAAARFHPRAGTWVVADDQLLATSGLATAVTVSTLLVLAIALAGSVVDRAFARRTESAIRAERRARDEGALRTLAHSLVVTDDLRQTLCRIAEQALEVGNADGAYIEVIHDAEVEVEAVAGLHAPPLGLRIPLPGSLTELALESGEPEAIDDILTDPRPIGEHLERSCGRCRAMLIPLRALSRPVGALILLRRREHPVFTERDLFSAAVVADLASLGILRAERVEERERLLRRISQLYEQAEEALSNRDEVLAIVSHDLRNPLTAISTRAQLLSRQAPPGAAGDVLRAGAEAIRTSTQRMATLIDDLADTAAMVQGRLAIVAGRVDPAELLREAARMFEPVAESRGLELQEERQEDLRPVACDHDRILQVLSNLLGNALRVTDPPGRITLEARADGAAVRFAVRDTGPGIAPADQDRIFGRHVRGTAAYKGAGLGLAISRGIVEAHGGRLWVESEVGVGSTFFFTLPVAT